MSQIVNKKPTELRYVERSVFTSGWGYKHYNKYTSQKFVNLESTNKLKYT